MTVIVAGKAYVDSRERDRYVAGCRELVLRAREAPGCLDVSISPDPIEEGRVNIYEEWESQETLDAWRAIAPPPALAAHIDDVQVRKHNVASSGPPFD